MIINFQVSKSSPKARVKYLIEGTEKEPRNKNRIDILEGNAELFLEKATLNTYKTKSFNFLISFAESKEELEAKLKQQGKTIQDIYDKIIEQITAGYQKEELNILAIGHADTDNYHIHITIDSRNQLTDTQLYFERTKQFINFLRDLERYIDLKYSLRSRIDNISLRDRGKALNEKIKEILDKRGEYKEKTRDEIKEELTNILSELILAGEINSRKELIEYLKDIEGIEINRIGKDYISLRYGNTKIRLKGGIYSNERFERIKTEIERAKTRDRANVQKELAELERRIEEIQSKRIQRIEKRFRTAKEKAKKRFEKTIKDISLSTSNGRLDIRSDNRDRNSSIQLQQEQTAIRRASDKEIGTRELAKGVKLPAIGRPTPAFIHRRKMEKRKSRYLHYSEISMKLRKLKKKKEEELRRMREEIERAKREKEIEEIKLEMEMERKRKRSYRRRRKL